MALLDSEADIKSNNNGIKEDMDGIGNTATDEQQKKKQAKSGRIWKNTQKNRTEM